MAAAREYHFKVLTKYHERFLEHLRGNPQLSIEQNHKKKVIFLLIFLSLSRGYVDRKRDEPLVGVPMALTATTSFTHYVMTTLLSIISLVFTRD